MKLNLKETYQGLTSSNPDDYSYPTLRICNDDVENLPDKGMAIIKYVLQSYTEDKVNNRCEAILSVKSIEPYTTDSDQGAMEAMVEE